MGNKRINDEDLDIFYAGIPKKLTQTYKLKHTFADENENDSD